MEKNKKMSEANVLGGGGGSGGTPGSGGGREYKRQRDAQQGQGNIDVVSIKYYFCYNYLVCLLLCRICCTLFCNDEDSNEDNCISYLLKLHLILCYVPGCPTK